MRRRTLLALAFAGGTLQIPLSVAAENVKTASSDSVIERLDADSKISPELRAYYFLSYANSLLDGVQKEDVLNSEDLARREFLRIHTTSMYTEWRREITILTDFAARDFKYQGQPTAIKVPAENTKLATSLIQAAIDNLSHCTDEISKLKLQFAASRLLKKTGDIDASSQINTTVWKTIKSCEEGNEKPDAVRILAAYELLNTLANAKVSIQIPDTVRPKQPEGTVNANKILLSAQSKLVFDEKDVKESEALKKKAIKIIDQLDKNDHTRRKAHRDLVLWYGALGKEVEADKEKQVLFDLVGIHDDRILFPCQGPCPGAVWWVVEMSENAYSCGRG